MGLSPILAQQTEREREQQFTYYWHAARQAKEAGQYDRALMLLLQCEQLNPKDAITLETIGLLYYGTNRKIQAINYITRAFYLDPGERWQTYYQLLDLIGGDDPDTQKQQLDALEIAAKANPDNVEIWEALVTIYAPRGDWNNTFHALDRIETLQGAQARCAQARHRIYRYLKDDKKAQAALEDYLKVDPGNTDILEQLLDFLFDKDAPLKKVRPFFERYVALGGKDAAMYNNYAWLLATNKTELDYAETLALRALNYDAYDANYIDTYAWILYLQGKRDQARYFIRQALQQATPGSDLAKEIQKHYNIIYKK